jgi:hypothetical protein
METKMLIEFFEMAAFLLVVGGLGLGVWCLTPLSTIYQLHRGG